MARAREDFAIIRGELRALWAQLRQVELELRERIEDLEKSRWAMRGRPLVDKHAREALEPRDEEQVSSLKLRWEQERSYEAAMREAPPMVQDILRQMMDEGKIPKLPEGKQALPEGKQSEGSPGPDPYAHLNDLEAMEREASEARQAAAQRVALSREAPPGPVSPASVSGSPASREEPCVGK